ncbi:beta strand repeat-containing protein [Methanoregula sp.]|jgi:hypothetical protein|uniref:beta strand repeat-containing protein n=1 Tax=Methanoregula sp. TaxID=2052170 RepID=UPI003C1CCFEB
MKRISILALALVALSLLVSAAAASVISIGDGQVNTIGGTASMNVTLDSASTGLSGYDITISAADPSVANITGYSFPSWATLNSNTTFPSSQTRVVGVDLNDQVQATNGPVTLGTVTLQGLKSGSSQVQITVNEIDDDAGNMVSPTVQPGTFSVTIAQPVGNITVSSTPAGAAIALDGTDTGHVTPFTIENITPGAHTVGVSLAGYQPVSQTVSVTAGANTKADFALAIIPPPMGNISVTSTPSGAAISLDGTDTGKVTPAVLGNIVPGTHMVNVSLTGYQPSSQTVTVTAGLTENADFQLVAIPTKGSISVTSTPAGASISIDGTDTGKVTPFTVDTLAPGDHVVAVSLTGYTPDSQTVTVTAGSTADADFQLVAIPTTGSISVTSTPSGAEVTIDGTDTGKVTPFTADSLTPGTHTVAISLTGYTPDSQTVTVAAGSTATADFQLVLVLKTGSLSVTSTPTGAAIAIDGADTGNTAPFTFSGIAEGDHLVEVTLAGYQTANRTVTITAGSTATADFTLVAIPTTGSISVTSTPAGAAISIDGTDTGKVTPFTIDNIAPGDHVVSVTLSGYNPASTTITVAAGDTAVTDFQLVQVPRTGSISVTSAPAGAAISLDGTDTSQVTPSTLDAIAPGSHTVAVDLSGYNPASMTVTVSTGSTATANFQLVAIPTTGSISVTSTPPGAAISVDGKGTGKVTPSTIDGIAPGDHSVTVDLTGYNPASMTVTVSAGSTATANLVLNQIPTDGAITVTSTPAGAAIVIDGTGTGNVTPSTFSKISPGDHAVTVSLSGYTQESKTVTVTAGSTTTADFTLVPVQQGGSITVTSVPAGASISLDGTSTGKITPATLDTISAGTHTVTVSLTGYTTASKTVTVSAGSTADASFRLTRAAKQADLSVAETVSNATAYVGQRVTWTMTVTNLGPDTARDIVVQKDGGRSMGANRREIGAPSAGFVRDNAWNIPELASGKSVKMTETDVYSVTGIKTESAKIVRSATKDPDMSNNAASASITIIAKPVPAPKITGISPSSGQAGKTLRNVVISGGQFRRGASVKFVESGQNTIIPTQVQVAGTGKIVVTLVIPKTAAAGVYDVVVTNTDGQSATLSSGFTVTVPKSPVITRISPTQGTAGSVIRDFTVSGQNFQRGATVTLTMSGQRDVMLMGTTVNGAGTITGTLSLPRGTATGSWDVVVTNPDGQSAVMTAAFNVKDTYRQTPTPTPTPGHRH